METKHTPGQWFVEKNCVMSQGRCVARLDWEIRDVIDDANAHLIAAAPDLLEALISVLNDSVDIECGDRILVRPHVDMIQAAIAKARGDV